MNDDQLLRYSRHILLDEIGIEGQQRLLAGTRARDRRRRARLAGRAVPGARPASGSITIVDARHGRPDQPAAPDRARHASRRAAQGRSRRRAASPASTPGAQVHGAAAARRCGAARRAGRRGRRGARLQRQLRHPPRRQRGLRRSTRKPLVSGAAIGFDGQISVYDTRAPTQPCYACVFPPDATFEEVRCATMGVFAPLVGIIGTMQAAEALEAAGRHRHLARRAAADARRPHDGVERDSHRPPARLRRVRSPS